MAHFDFDQALRWGRFSSASKLERRPDKFLPFVHEDRIVGQALLLDSCVYIDQMQNRTPSIVESLVETRQINHSTVALQELMHTVGVLDPKDNRTAGAVKAIGAQIRAIPNHRLFAPDPEILGKAALMAGVLCRSRSYSKDNRFSLLHDCVLFLQAHKHGFCVLTANIGDFDLLLQLIPLARVLFYRKI